MATTNYAWNTPARGTKDWHILLNANFDSIDADLFAVETAINEVETDATLVANGHEADGPLDLASALVKLSTEQKNARGNLASMDARISGVIDDDGVLIGAVTASDQWPVSNMTNPVYASSSTFKVDGDATGILQPDTSIRIEFDTSGLKYLHVKSASYAAGPDETTVTIWDDEVVLNEVINEVAWGFQRANDIDNGAATPGSQPRDMEACSYTILRYNAASYDDPFDTTGARVDAGNTGRVAQQVYASGLTYGYEYDAAGDVGITVTVYRRINNQPAGQFDVTRSGELITAVDRS